MTPTPIRQIPIALELAPNQKGEANFMQWLIEQARLHAIKTKAA